MISLFIDANVYLHFYAYSDDDLIELDKLSALVEADELRIYVNQQLRDEIARNRETKISEALDTFKKSGAPVKIPRFARQFEKAEELIDLSKELQKAKAALSKDALELIEQGKLKADKSIEDLLSKAQDLEIGSTVLEAGRWRQIRGNPPGKPSSIGDQIHWEALLQAEAVSGDLHIVSRDGDFSSVLNSKEPNPRLQAEWEEIKGADLFIYQSLGAFTKKHFQSISLPSDVTKSSAISKLVGITNFENTHKQIARLQKFIEEITLEEATVLFQALIDNNQISWIAEDDDVKEFYSELRDKYWLETSDEMDKELLKVADYLDPIPF